MPSERVHIIACGVLAVDVCRIARDLDLDIQAVFLPGGLHNNPHELRRRLHQTIDEVSALGDARQIPIGYGVCGRGAVGIHARHIPLVIPPVHGCIALSLGSDAACRPEFARYPGTYNISAGSVTERPPPLSSAPSADGCRCANPELQELIERHGQENAHANQHFLSSWQRNYQRAAFIDTGATADPTSSLLPAKPRVRGQIDKKENM